MLTRFKEKDIQKLLDEEECIETLGLIADKFRVIYTALGWTHMTKEFFKTDEVLRNLVDWSLKALKEKQKDIQVATAGMKLQTYYDEEGFINMDFNFVVE